MALASALGMTGAALAADAEATAGASGWTFDVSALALRRSAPGGGAIIAANPALTPFLSGSDFDFGWSPGFDATLGHTLHGKESIEARLMYARMGATDSFVTPGNFIGVGFTGPGGATADSTYDTTFLSGEFNWRHRYNDRVSVLAGLRYIGVQDTLRTVLNGNVATGLYEADNDLFGAQLGAELALFDKSSRFLLDLTGKVGLFANNSSAGIREFQGNNFIGQFQSGPTQATSLAAELGVKAGYRISDRASLTAGYQLLWANNLALASNAAAGSLTNPGLLATTVFRDDILLHGFNVGLKVAF